MLVIVGSIIVLASVAGGYMWHGGELLALHQPSEVLIIFGAALGALIIANPMSVIKNLISQITGVFKGGLVKQDYEDLLVMMFEVFNIARRDGLVGLESHIEKPEESEIFKRYPTFLKNHHACTFFSDTMRVIITGSVQPYDLEDMMDEDIEVMHEEENLPPEALSSIADALPGLGIVAAVLGIVITMSYIDGPPAVIGQKVAAALVGTFIGIFASYGFFGPLARTMTLRNNETKQYFSCMKHALLSFHKGVAGVIAVEFARRSLYAEVRPGFIELENACDKAKRR